MWASVRMKVGGLIFVRLSVRMKLPCFLLPEISTLTGLSSFQNDSIVAGGGAIEMELSKYLRDYSRTIPGKQQLLIGAYAKALEVIPRQLCDNAGFDATNILNKLRAKHAQVENKTPLLSFSQHLTLRVDFPVSLLSSRRAVSGTASTSTARTSPTTSPPASGSRRSWGSTPWRRRRRRPASSSRSTKRSRTPAAAWTGLRAAPAEGGAGGDRTLTKRPLILKW